MKTISTTLKTHLCGDTTLAELIKITRTDGVIKAFTTFDRDLAFDGVTYAADGSFSPAEVTNAAQLKTNNFNVTGILASDTISASDLDAGLYDHARIDVYICNWADLTQGVVQMRRGWLGEVTQSGGKYVASLRGLHDLLQRNVGETYTPECRYDLGDRRCALSLTAYAGAATSVTDAYTFGDINCTGADGVYNYGKLTWTSGANNGLSMEVKAWDASNHLFTLWLPMPYAINVGDAYSVTSGCDKKFATCCDKFGNAANFGGFPHLPGLAKILEYPESS